jgi:CHASE2 domain-containing sensor protein
MSRKQAIQYRAQGITHFLIFAWGVFWLVLAALGSAFHGKPMSRLQSVVLGIFAFCMVVTAVVLFVQGPPSDEDRA